MDSAQHLDHNGQLGVGRDQVEVALLSVGQVRADDDLAVPADSHAFDAVEEAGDELLSINTPVEFVETLFVGPIVTSHWGAHGGHINDVPFAQREAH